MAFMAFLEAFKVESVVKGRGIPQEQCSEDMPRKPLIADVTTQPRPMVWIKRS
jgi:hypothetical protein